jgi:hypothetical protein
MEQVLGLLHSLLAFVVGDLMLQVLLGGVFALVFGAGLGLVGLLPVGRRQAEQNKMESYE